MTFPSTNHAILGESLLLKHKCEVKVMPLPSLLRAGCGLCLRISPEEIAPSLTLLKERGVVVDGLYRATVCDGKTTYEEECLT